MIAKQFRNIVVVRCRDNQCLSGLQRLGGLMQRPDLLVRIGILEVVDLGGGRVATRGSSVGASFGGG